MANVATKKPIPKVDEESKGYWEACRRHELRVQRCLGCGTLRHHPRAVCPKCTSPEVEWTLCSGRGVVYTFTVTWQNQAPTDPPKIPITNCRESAFV